jgi:putative (di)nucleoside polyphosphate hydrolase
MSGMFRPNVSAIVFRRSDGKYLLVHKAREHHAWQFPQGGVDEGESYEDALRRELKEELGTDKFRSFRKSDHVLFYEFQDGILREGKYKGQKQTYFLVEFIGADEDISLDEKELDDFSWVYQAELPEHLESQEYLNKINQVIFELKEDL